MLYVKLVSVQLISGVTPGKIEKAILRTMAMRILVNQVPRRLNQVLLGFSSLFVHIYYYWRGGVVWCGWCVCLLQDRGCYH